MLSDAQAGRFSHLAIYRVDRFGRDTAEGLRVAKVLHRIGIHVIPSSNPSLDISTPDGWMMFTIMLGMGEHEVEVLRESTEGGMRAKLESGGWCSVAPDGFINRRKEINAGKSERWIEIDPERAPIIREAFDLLLTGEYSLNEICEELDRRGHLRNRGARWAWTQGGKRKTAAASLSRILHNPLYAGWVVSERFDIRWGQVRSTAGAIVTEAEWERAQQILEEHNRKKLNTKHSYLLQGMLALELTSEEIIAMRCQTTVQCRSNKNHPYYFLEKTALRTGADSGLYFPAQDVEDQVIDLVTKLSIDTSIVSEVRTRFRMQVTQAVEDNVEARIATLKRRLSELQETEKKYARLWASGRLTDDAYDDLLAEVCTDRVNAQATLAQIERGRSDRVQDLDKATALLERVPKLWTGLTYQEQRQVLRTIFREIRIDVTGQVQPSPLHAPFAYLTDTARRVTHVTQSDAPAEKATASASTCDYYGTPAAT